MQRIHHYRVKIEKLQKIHPDSVKNAKNSPLKNEN